MAATDSFVIYLKAHPDGRILQARYEVFGEASWAMLEATQMAEAWMEYSSDLHAALHRLLEAALTATLNMPTEAQLLLVDERPLPGWSLLAADLEGKPPPAESF